MEPMLTQRREGAKSRGTSNGRISISNLSALAPLRETSARPSQEESFTLRRDAVAVFAQFMRKQDFVYDFEDARPEPGVQAVGRVNDHSRDFILFDAAKLVLLLLICE